MRQPDQEICKRNAPTLFIYWMNHINLIIIYDYLHFFNGGFVQLTFDRYQVKRNSLATLGIGYPDWKEKQLVVNHTEKYILLQH